MAFCALTVLLSQPSSVSRDSTSACSHPLDTTYLAASLLDQVIPCRNQYLTGLTQSHLTRRSLEAGRSPGPDAELWAPGGGCRLVIDRTPLSVVG